jgi:Tol biopolymer transport system component
VIGDLEQYAVWRDSRRIHSVDFNFWGLTFERDGNRFYATLDTRGVQYLVHGDIDRREVRIVRPDVECPSLSPDNTTLVFKRLIGARSRGWWQLARLDLATNAETVLTNETRSVDDQVEWLDDGAVMYHLTGSGSAADLWVLSVDGVSPPRRLLANAYSPSVVR